jgi:hypothetical protein
MVSARCGLGKFARGICLSKGFGRCRISVLFRSVDLQLDKPLLGWDIGTFEFLSDSITATGVDSSSFSSMKLKLRTGGSTAKVPRSKAKGNEEGVEWPSIGLRLPVRYRYMSPVVIEFHLRGVRNKADAHAIVWLPTVIDNETLDFKLPIYKSDNSQRLTQNFIENPEQEEGVTVEKLGYLEFRGRFKAGLDEDHDKFLSDNDQRETLETFEACVTEGLRTGIVKREVGPAVEKLATDAYGEKPDVDSESGLEDPTTSAGKTISSRKRRGNGPGTQTDADFRATETSREPNDQEEDWSQAFGEDPYTLLRKREGRDSGTNQARPGADEEKDNETSDSDEDTGVIGKIKEYKSNQKDLHRKHRGAMQWKPVRTMKAIKDQMKVGVAKTKTRFSMTGREPDVEVYDLMSSLTIRLKHDIF